ncbi:sensor histidine kinase [Syntrophomonas zehnderi]|nr:sensor histidine kinase KdpD [Syntrophomonas zehnderi]
MHKERRADPDALLDTMKKKGRGRLTVFLGAAAGVGKTYAMLEAARERRAEGVDVVAGWIETHGRRETEALVGDLEVLPPRLLEYRGRQFPEMDLDGLLDRKPEIALVDELAHTNIEGSRHSKRYQDVEELLAAGIDVYTAVNIQHLESANDIVARITGILVKETVPDTILKHAEIQLIDIPTEELLQRLKEGKVYVADKAAEAITKFFRPGNINALREMSLRYTALHVDNEMQTYMKAHAIEGPWPAGERVMVCISSSPFATQLIRAAHRMALRLKAEWLVVYVETPGIVSRSRLSRDRLLANLRLAEELGAEIISTSGTDIAAELLQIARSRNVTQVVIGKPLRPRLLDILRGSVVDQVIRSSEGFGVHVIPGHSAPKMDSPGWLSEKKRRNILPYAKMLGVVFLITLLLYPLHNQLGLVNVAMIYLLPILYSAVRWKRTAALLGAFASALCLDFFFIPPQQSLTVADIRYILSFAIFFVVAWVTGTMAARLKRQIDDAHQRESMVSALYGLSREIGAVYGIDEVLPAVIKKVEAVSKGAAVILLPGSNGSLELKADSESCPQKSLTDNEMAVAAWAFQHLQKAGQGTDTLSGAELVYFPLATEAGPVGVLGIRPTGSEKNLLREKTLFIEALANLAAVAVNRIQLAERAREVQIAADSERLRTALFNSISHDLRTPLTSIIGSVSGLLEEEQLYDAASRRIMLENIQQGALRMHHLVTNLLDMARLNSGFLQLNKQFCDIQDIIGVAVSRVEHLDTPSFSIYIEPGLPLVEVDFVLIEQVIVNLLDNAVKYSGNSLNISITAHRQAEKIEVAVADRGPGIAPENRETIFNSFFRLQSTANISGTGLGLAICKSIIEAHGGEIEATDNPGGGTVISFRIPPGEVKSVLTA